MTLHSFKKFILYGVLCTEEKWNADTSSIRKWLLLWQKNNIWLPFTRVCMVTVRIQTHSESSCSATINFLKKKRHDHIGSTEEEVETGHFGKKYSHKPTYFISDMQANCCSEVDWSVCLGTYTWPSLHLCLWSEAPVPRSDCWSEALWMSRQMKYRLPEQNQQPQHHSKS